MSERFFHQSAVTSLENHVFVPLEKCRDRFGGIFRLYKNDVGWRLAPAYDLTYSNTYWGEHTTSVNDKGRDIADDDLITVGKAAGIPEATCKKYLCEIRDKTGVLAGYL